MTIDLCGFCGGELHASDVEPGWVFVCQVCGRETILSDQMIQLVGEQS